MEIEMKNVKKDKVKKDKVKKVREVFKVAKNVKLETTPEEFLFDKFPLIAKELFKDESFWIIHRAEQLEFKARKLRQKAKDFSQFGNKKDRTKATKLKKMQNKMAELKKELIDAGIDVDDLLA